MEVNEDIIEGEETNEHHKQSKFKFTVEVPIFLSMLGLSIAAVPISNLLMYRTCLHPLNHTKEDCSPFLAPDRLNHSQALEEEVQAYTAKVTTAKVVLESLVPVFVALTISAWSDKHGRKPLIVWPLIGVFTSFLMASVYSLVDSIGPWWLIVTSLPLALSGGTMLFLTGALCYISDVSTKDRMSIRLIYIQIAFGAAATLGGFLSPYILEAVGNVSYLLVIVTALVACAYVHANVFVEESLRTATPGTITNILNCEHIREILNVCFEKKPNFRRAITLLIILASFLSIFTSAGIGGVAYLYTRNKIQWSMKDYTTYSASGAAISFSGALLAVQVIQRIFKVSDLNFTMISFFSGVIEYSIKALATTTWHMYFGMWHIRGTPCIWWSTDICLTLVWETRLSQEWHANGSAVAIFGTVSGPLMRSFVTKTLPEIGIAKVFSLISSMESLATLLAPIVYNTLYSYTLVSMPGVFYFLSAGVNLICVAVIINICYALRKTSNAPAYQSVDNT